MDFFEKGFLANCKQMYRIFDETQANHSAIKGNCAR